MSEVMKWPNGVLKTDLNEKLGRHDGTDNHYTSDLSLTLYYTDGVKYMAQTYQAYWLILEVAILNRLIEDEPFIVMRLERCKQDETTFILTADDGDENILKRVKIENCDFVFDTAKFYIENNVILLPSER